MPPQPPKEIEPPPLPPPPPETSNSPIPKPTEPQNQVEDMELSDEESETTPIIETQNNGKVELKETQNNIFFYKL